MKLIYIANIRLPTEKAHGIQIMKTCEAFSNAGHEVQLVVPQRKNKITQDPFDFYRVKRIFSITRLFTLDLVHLGPLGFIVESLVFSLSVLWKVRRVTSAKDFMFYSRDEMTAFFLSLMNKKVVWEAHMGHNNFFIRSLIRRDTLIVCISHGLSDFYCSLGAKRLMVSPDGVDLEQFQITDTKESARAKLGLPQETKLVVYTGHLYSWKGADTLADAASTLERGTLVLFVGGTENDIELFKGKYGEKGNVMILGNKPHDSIPLYLRAADVLALPNSGKEKISQLYTSPMKLFEYMASGTPIVASDLPSLREVLNDKNAVLVPPDSPMELARGLKELLADRGKASALARQALGDVEQYDWEKRAGGILSFIS